VWNTHESPVDSLAAALASSHDAGTRLRDYIERSRIPDWPSDALSRRLLHFLREDARVAEALPAFLDTNVRAVGELALDSQADSEGLLGNQVVQTIALSRLAIQGGAFAARSFGAGFGGSVWALVPRERAAAFADEWLGAYEKKFSGSRPSVTFVAPPGPSLIEFHS
jgi:galactokinase